MRKTTSKAFRDLCKATYPNLDIDITYWRFMRYLFFGIKTKEGHLLIDGFHLSKAENKTHLFVHNNYCGLDFLKRFKLSVMPDFTWSDWSYKNKVARVAYPQFPLEITDLLEKEKVNMKESRVYFDTGKKFTTKQQKVERELLKEEARTYFEFARPEAKDLLEYMNNLPTNSFSKVITANFNSTFLAASNIENTLIRDIQLNILLSIKDDLQPLYKPSVGGNTVRIFPFNYSIPMLKRELRKQLTKGWYEFDLANSQLAIVGKTWNIKEVQDFLLEGRKIWNELFTHFGISYTYLKQEEPSTYEAIKKVFKDNLYSTIYGMWRNNVSKDVTTRLEAFGINQGGITFLKYPLIKTLFEARDKRMQKLSLEGVTKTIFDKELVVKGGFTKKGLPDTERKDSLRSILAEQAQALELYIMLPALDLAKTTSDFQITLWMHDGFSVNFTSSTKQDRWLQRIINSVNERANALGVITYLEVETL